MAMPMSTASSHVLPRSSEQLACCARRSLGDAYELAWQEWEQLGEAGVWESTAADALPHA